MNLDLAIITIVLDGMPYIERHLPVFDKLKLRWKWMVSHGVAMPNDDTSWVRRMVPRLSEDGTTEYLDSIAAHPNVLLQHNPQWHSKLAQVNFHLGRIKSPCVVLQVDSDEIWTADQIERIVGLFRQPKWAALAFKCRFFVGPNLAVRLDCGDHNFWMRAWKFVPGCRFRSHEPPLMGGIHGPVMEPPETEQIGLVFDHYSYANLQQVKLKQKYYGYEGAVDNWYELQRVKEFPVRVRDFLPWANAKSMAEPLNAEPRR